MTILATIIVLGVLIFVHELGHFMAAKAVGVDVQRFSIGLGPKVVGFKRGDTEYVLSAIPLGGFVKMGGMADDEVTSKLEGGQVPDEEKRGPRPGDFDSKPIWARTLVISAGVIMNMLFAFGVYTFSAAVWGFREPATTRVGAVEEPLPDGTEDLFALPVGATLQRIGDRTLEHWGDVIDAFLEGPAGPTTVTYTGPAGSLEVRVPQGDAERRQVVVSLRHWIEPEVGMLNPGSPAERAGLESGDRILAVDGETLTTWWHFVDQIEARPEQRTEIQLLRNGREITRVATPEAFTGLDPTTGEEVTIGRVGIYPVNDYVFERVSPLQSVRVGAMETWSVTALIVGFLGDLVTGQVPARSVGSIFTIGEASGQAAQAGLDTFLRFMALFSINLAVLNLLPIPILDGGHLLFLAIEKLRGRALSVEQRLRWSNVGLIIVMGLMVWALSNDVLRLLGL